MPMPQFGRATDPYGYRKGAKIYLRDNNPLKNRFGDEPPDGLPPANVRVIRDRYSLYPSPLVIYNAKLGVPRPANLPADINLDRAAFQALTPFQLHTRGIELSAEQHEDFERGDWICIVPAYDEPGLAGPPNHGPIGLMATKALYAHCVRAHRVLQAVEYRKQREHLRFDHFKRKHLNDLGPEQLLRIKRAIDKITKLYTEPQVSEDDRKIDYEHLETKARKLANAWYKQSNGGLRGHALVEALCYEQFHESFDPEVICEHELLIIRSLRTAQLRAIAVYRLQRLYAADDLKRRHQIKSRTAARLDHGHDRDLNLFECFLTAMHGGYNPAMLYRGLAEYVDLFDLGAWLGYFGRGDVDLLTPEVALTLLGILKLDLSTFKIEEEEDEFLRLIYGSVQHAAGIMVGRDELIEVAQRAIEFCEPAAVPRRVYNVAIVPFGANADHPRLSLDPRVRLGVGDGTKIVLTANRNQSAEDKGEVSFDPDEKFWVRKFHPLIW